MNILIYGCGGHGRVILDILIASHGAALEAAFVDDNPAQAGRSIDGVPVFGSASLPELLRREFAAIVGIGDNTIRGRVFHRLRAAGFVPATAVHPSAVVSPRAIIGPGAVLMPGAIVNTGSRIGPNACINTAASVDHDCVVSPHAHVFPGARLTGNVHVGPYATVGTGVCVAPGVRIGACSIVGAGSVVLRDIPSDVVAYGAPARVVRSRVERTVVGGRLAVEAR